MTTELPYTLSHTTRETQRDAELKKALITRLNRIEGQVRGLRAMIERDTYCDDVLGQIAAARAALDSAGKLLLESHIRSCVVRDVREGKEKAVDELIGTIGRLLR